MANPTPAVLWREQQRFNQPWLWLIVFSMAVLVCWIFGQPLLPNHLPNSQDPPLLLAAVFVAFTALVMPLLIYLCRLTTEVRSDVLLVQFFPFHTRPVRIEYGTITACHAVQYNPLLDYGGWGLRYGLGGRAYNVSGNLGVRLEFSSGPALLIGSQHPMDLAAAIETAVKAIRQQGFS
jgi:hypothetical protein